MGMFDFMENPHMGQYMGQMGMGLLAASQPQPYGVNRYSLIQNSMNQANQSLMRQQMFDMQKEEYEEKKEERNKIKTAQSKLFGGEDPSTDITWDAGRVGMSPEETMSNVGQVAPGAAITHMLAKPKGPGKPYMVQEGNKKVYYRDVPDGQGGFTQEKLGEGPAWKPTEPSNISAITLRNTDTDETVSLNRKDPRLKNFLGPDSPWVEEQRTRTGELSATRIDDLTADIDLYDRTISEMDETIARIEQNRATAGVGGKIMSIIQEGIGITTDLAELGIDVDMGIQAGLEELSADINSGQADPAIAGRFFNPALPKNEVYENRWAYILAKTRKTGKRAVAVQDVLNAKPDVKIMGFKSTDSVLTKLRTVQAEIAGKSSDLKARRKQDRNKSGVPQYEIRDGVLVEIE